MKAKNKIVNYWGSQLSNPAFKQRVVKSKKQYNRRDAKRVEI